MSRQLTTEDLTKVAEVFRAEHRRQDTARRQLERNHVAWKRWVVGVVVAVAAAAIAWTASEFLDRGHRMTSIETRTSGVSGERLGVLEIKVESIAKTSEENQQDIKHVDRKMDALLNRFRVPVPPPPPVQP